MLNGMDRAGKSLAYCAYCLLIVWVGCLGLDYWASAELANRIQNGLPIFGGILAGEIVPVKFPDCRFRTGLSTRAYW
jgi:hypothetical protein